VVDSIALEVARRKPTKAELEEMRARHARVLANAQRTCELAEKAQAKLDAERSQR
jgi:Skp family chaperone for outer membrane proteins